jgi:phage minor structural protein
LNGVFELNMLYPSNGAYIKELKNNRIIFADTGNELGNQPFRICRVTKLLNGVVNVYAHHISYDLGGVQLPPFEASGTADAFRKIKQYSTTENAFTFESTVIDDKALSIPVPKSIRAYLMGEKDSVLQSYGGEFTFDRFHVRHSTIRGSDKGFRVKYGVNMVDLNQEESIEKTYTGIYPYYKDEYMFMDLSESYDLMYPHEVDTSKLSKKIMYAKGEFSHRRIANIDLSPYFDIAPLEISDLEEIAREYMEKNEIGIPRVSLDVRYESMRKSPEYANVIFLEDVSLGDTIHVDFVKLGVSSVGRINSIIYDSLQHKNKRVSIGSPKSNIADTITSITNSVKGSETNILGISRSVAKIDILTNQNAAKVELLVETNKAGQNVVRGSVLVEAINGQSTATINADKVNLKGYVTVSSLTKTGTTEIDGSRITTGQILSRNFSDESVDLIQYAFKAYESGTYFFQFESTYFYFTITQTVPFGGSIKFYRWFGKIQTFDTNGNEIETVDCTTTAYPGSLMDLDVSIYFSESGTKIDLENGEIISNQFSIKNDGTAYFGGELKVNFGRIGPFDVSMRGLATTNRGCGISLVDTGLYFTSDVYGTNEDGKVTFIAGDLIQAPYGDPHVVEIKNSSGDSLKITPKAATMTGSWKATPYKNPSKAASEIVTKQDLIDLGLITA